MKLYEDLQRILDRAGAWITAHSNASVAALSVLYWLAAGSRAIHKELWFDELVTWHIARLPSLAAIWAALKGGADQNLILLHLLVRASQFLFGTGEFATRLPALTGFWVLALCTYLFLKRRLPVPFALAAFVFPMVTYAWEYAFEARAYGIVMCGAALALVCWQRAAEAKARRRLALAGITVGLAAGLLSSYTAVLVLLPLAAGEVARTLERRRIDLPVWAAFAAAAPAMLTYPILLAATSRWNLHGMSPDLMALPRFYTTLLEAAIFPITVAAAAVYLVGREPGSKEPRYPILPRYEAVALLCFAFLPAAWILPARALKHFLFWPRYTLSAVIGVTALLAVIASRACEGSRRAGATVLMVLTVWFSAMAWHTARDSKPTAGEPVKTNRPVMAEALRYGLPIVIPYDVDFLALDHYIKDPGASRFYLPLDQGAAEQYWGNDMSYQFTSSFARFVHLRGHVVAYQDFVREQPHFLVYYTGGGQQEGWLNHKMLDAGFQVKLRSTAAKSGAATAAVLPTSERLFEVTVPSGASPE
jgi:hypothetical protein